MTHRASGSAPAGVRRGITWRAIGVSLLAMPLCAYWAQDATVDRIFSIAIPPMFLTIVMLALNTGVRRAAPRWALSEAELVVFYAMQTVACAIASEWMDCIQPYIYSYALYQTQDTRFPKILPHLSNLLFFTSAKGIEDYAFGGKPPAYFLSRLPLWWPKIISWTVIIGLVCLAMQCVNSLMRDQWTRRERLAFPLIQLPMAMLQGGGSSPFWRNRAMWGGFAIMFAIDMLNGFSFLHPWLPTVTVRFLGDLTMWFSTPPWSEVGWTPIGIFPFMAAIGLFMPTDLLFSCVFFFFVRKGQQVVAASLGYEQGVFGGGGLVPSAPYFSEQSWGAFLGLFGTSIWVARGYLRGVWREVLRGGSEEHGLVSHRTAFAGLVASIIALGWIGMAIGLPFMFVLLYVVLFLAFSIAMTRLRAQLGPPTHEMAFMGPNQLIVDFRGSQGLSTALINRSVTAFHFMNRIHRTHPMPSQLEAVKMAEASRMDQRAMFAAVMLAVVGGSVFGHLSRLFIGYHFTPMVAGGETAGVVQTLTDQPRPTNIMASAVVVISAGLVLLLDFIRFRVPAFPFHPAGYALAMNFGVDYYWFGLILVLMVKVLVQRYSGLRGYEKLRMIAFGIILAEFTAGGIWSIASIIMRSATYSVSINGRLGWTQ